MVNKAGKAFFSAGGRAMRRVCLTGLMPARFSMLDLSAGKDYHFSLSDMRLVSIEHVQYLE
ncbi:MAG: hypothetical protein J1E80_01495 [Desulfovibrionaceae bacterium]|nr:hypothetical protein [Desulfovibrionaceae bacterium]